MKPCSLMSMLSGFILFLFVSGSAIGVQGTEIAFRLGQGGFRDHRAPDGDLGGGQLCLDLKFNDLPFVASIGHEYYTKGPDATEVYEIESLAIFNVFYMKVLSKKWPTNLYLGGGFGLLEIPQGDKAVAVQGIGRIETKLFLNISGYAEGKYIHSKKGLVDFDVLAVFLGISFKFQL